MIGGDAHRTPALAKVPAVTSGASMGPGCVRDPAHGTAPDSSSGGLGVFAGACDMIDLVIEQMTTAEVLALNRQTLHELYRRGVIRTLNPPTGDWAELLVATAYRGQLAPNSEKSFDVATPEGRRLQVKGRILNPDRVGSHILSAVRSWDFDACVVVLLSTEDLSVLAASEIPAEALREVARYREHTNAWVVRPTPAVMALGEDVADRLRAAAESL